MLKFLFNRVVVLYLIFSAFIVLSFDMKSVDDAAKLSVLNRLFPEFSRMKEQGDLEEDYYLKNHKRSIYYYQKIVDFMPSRFDAFSILGFSYYEVGNEIKAIESYEKAIAASSKAFWPFYNLGVIYFNNGDYEKAGEYFSQAIKTNPRENIGLLLTTKVYSQFHGGNEIKQKQMVESLGRGYEHAHILLNLSRQFIAHPNIRNIPIAAVLDKLGVGNKIKDDFFTKEGKGVVRIF